MKYARQIKSQDLLVLFEQVANADRVWTYASLGEALRTSASQVRRSVRRCVTAGLAVEHGRGEWQAVRSSQPEFASHGVRRAFPAVLGAPRRGMPTACGAAPLVSEIFSAVGTAPVWPHVEGSMRPPSESKLPSRGFVRDASSGVIRRWKHRASGVSFDLRPTGPAAPGLAHCRNPEAVRSATAVARAPRLRIRLIAAPRFVATRPEAFASRGRSDLPDLPGRDLEDLPIVVGGGPALGRELEQASSEPRAVVGEALARRPRRDDFENLLPGEIADADRAGLVLGRLRQIAAVDA